MIFIPAGFVFGAALGAFQAWRRGGKPLDMLQYAAAHAILFTLIGLFVTIFLDRSVQ